MLECPVTTEWPQQESCLISAPVVARLVQISDCHLFADPQGALLGLKTEESLQDVLEHIDHFEKPKGIDTLLVTGDLSQDGSPQSYQRLWEKTRYIGQSQGWIQGNHDLDQPMQAYSGLRPVLSPGILQPHPRWQVILLNSSVEHQIHGHISAEHLLFLEQSLARANGIFSLVVTHHPPCHIGCAWLDRQCIDNPGRLEKILDQYQDTVRAVLCGHVHQQAEVRFAATTVWTSPSTCIQFKPASDGFALDPLGPGYRVLELLENGGIRTYVSRVQASDHLDTLACGY